MALQTAIIILIFTGHRFQIVLIKVWSALLMIVGGAGLLVVFSQFLLFRMNYENVDLEKLSIQNLFTQISILLIGWFFYKGIKKYVILRDH